MPGAKKAKTGKSVETLRHEDADSHQHPHGRVPVNGPAGEEPPIRAAYQRRNRDLDPQLVWRGKDEQDESDLVVNAPALYIQEKVHPKALIADLMRQSKENREPADRQINMFADFNGLPEGVDRTEFYQHDGYWQNRMVLGDSLQVMASLAEREGLQGRVQCIYVDPPYGIRFNSNFQWSTTSRDVRDGSREHITREPEQVKAFRDTWRDGIHSYLTYLRDRLTVARDLLTDSGSIFVQIGDENVHRVRALMDEVFGDENFVSVITFQKSGGLTAEHISSVTDFIVWYAKSKEGVKSRKLFRPRDTVSYQSSARDSASITGTYQSVALTSSHEYSRGKDSFNYQGRSFSPSARYWSTSPEGLKRLEYGDRLLTTANTLRYKMLFSDFPVMPISNVWSDMMGATGIIYVVQDECKSHRAMHPDGHRPRGSGAGPHLRLRHHRIRRRAVGTALDHHRHLTGRSGLGPRSYHVRTLPLLPLGGQPRGAAQGG